MVMKVLYNIKNFYNRHPGLCFWGMLILFVLPISFVKVYDIDIWWHMQRGKSILLNFAGPDFSKYYFTPVNTGASSLRYTFLGDIIFYLIYLLSGDFGLQMMRLCAVLSACILFRSLAGKEYKPWHLLLLMIFVVGTYQKQLIRNSLYAYYMVPVLFWIWHNIRYEQKQWYIWLYPVVLGLWSCLHGSYLLGFCLVALIFAGDILDNIRANRYEIKKCIFVHTLVLSLSLLVISLWNPATLNYLRLSTWIAHEQVKTELNHNSIDENKTREIDELTSQFKELSIRSSDFIPVKKQKPGFFYSAKHWLNNTIFKTSGQATLSADFVSPFDKLNRLYVWISLFSGLIGLVFILFFIRPLRFSLVLPFFGILFIGTGYLRLCGYIPFITTAVLFTADLEKTIKPRLKKKYILKASWALSFLLVVLIWIDCFLQFPVRIGTSLHAFGLGRIPIYSTECPDRVISEYKTNKVFNTMTTGGYLLYQWFPRKKVFIDGFFSPHPAELMLHLRIMHEKGVNPDFLFARYGINVALVDHISGSILHAFFTSENWYARYIDTGMVCFVYRPDYASDIKIPEVLFTDKDMDKMSYQFKRFTANSLHTIVNTLLKKGRIKDAGEFIKQNSAILKGTQSLVAPDFISVTEQLRVKGQKIYGLKNTKLRFYEYKHNKAIERGDIKSIIKYGLKVLEKRPDRFPIIMNLAITYFKIGKIDACIQMLNRFGKDLKKSTPYLNKNKTRIAKLYWGLSNLARQQNQYVKAYDLAWKTSRIVPDLISYDKLYRIFIKDVAELNATHQEKSALSLLKAMGQQFHNSALWLNDMSRQIRITDRTAEYLK